MGFVAGTPLLQLLEEGEKGNAFHRSGPDLATAFSKSISSVTRSFLSLALVAQALSASSSCSFSLDSLSISPLRHHTTPLRCLPKSVAARADRQPPWRTQPHLRATASMRVATRCSHKSSAMSSIQSPILTSQPSLTTASALHLALERAATHLITRVDLAYIVSAPHAWVQGHHDFICLQLCKNFAELREGRSQTRFIS